MNIRSLILLISIFLFNRMEGQVVCRVFKETGNKKVLLKKVFYKDTLVTKEKLYAGNSTIIRNYSFKNGKLTSIIISEGGSKNELHYTYSDNEISETFIENGKKVWLKKTQENQNWRSEEFLNYDNSIPVTQFKRIQKFDHVKRLAEEININSSGDTNKLRFLYDITNLDLIKNRLGNKERYYINIEQDSANYKIKNEYLLNNGEIELSSVIIFNKHNIIKEEKYALGVLFEMKEWIYNNNSLIREIKTEGSKRHIVYFDSAGRVCKEEIFSSGDLSYRLLYTYSK